MLNPTFSASVQQLVHEPYVAPEALANQIVSGNEQFDTGTEYRLQKVYEDELWLKFERAGLLPERLQRAQVLEVCGGTGFLTYHFLARCQPENLVVNDISAKELASAKELISKKYPESIVEWTTGDMHSVEFGQKFDIIMGNSFLHHFHNVPEVLSRFAALLKEDGVFVSLHEPTPMSTVVEGAKLLAYPPAVLAPAWINDVARARYHGAPSATDLWMFEPSPLEKIAIESGFKSVELIPWHLIRPIVVQRYGLHLSNSKPHLTPKEERQLLSAVNLDSKLNRVLPQRFFGSFCLVCKR